MKKKKICVITATRAEYGVLKNTIQQIEKHPELELCLVVTGTHLSEKFGYTINEIREDGFPIAEEVNILPSTDSPEAVSKSMGIAMISFADVMKRQKPDMIVVVGDRYELLPICGCALNSGIPIAHISGGEVTEGAIDDCIRHCITKMSRLHFPGCEEYRQRIIQLGEDPSTVFNYGDVGLENIYKTEPIEKGQLEKDLNMSLENYICMTFHPVTTQLVDVKRQLEAVLEAVDSYQNIDFVITKANADAGGEYINGILEGFVKAHENCHLFSSLGIKRYINVLKGAKAIIGNSSSGIIEAPILKVPTVNIGDRQKGRLKADSIVDCEPVKEQIVQAIDYVLSEEGQQKAKNTVSPYHSDETSKKIVEEIARYLHMEHKAKKFFDIKFEQIM